MKKSILIAAFVAAFASTATAQRQFDTNRDTGRDERVRSEENRTDRKLEERRGTILEGDNQDKQSPNNATTENRYQNRGYENNTNNDRPGRDADRNDNRRGNNNDRREYGNRNNNYGGNWNRNNNYGGNWNGNYGGNWNRNNNYGRDYDVRSYHRWNYDYAPQNWNAAARNRIIDGQRRGLITGFESRRLFRELQRVEEIEYDYSRNGYFSNRERNNLIQEIQELNRDISHYSNDNDYGMWNNRRWF